MAPKASVFIATSLDGFIARKNGDLDWLDAANATVLEGEDCGFGAFMRTVDALVMGRNTYEKVLSFGAWPYGDTPVIVMSSDPITFPDAIPDSVEHSSEEPRDLCERLSRDEVREGYEDDNAKANEFLYRRVDIEDVVSAHLLAMEKVRSIRFDRYIISATSPFLQDDLIELRTDAAAVLKRRIPDYEVEYGRRGWKMFPRIDRVYVNERARGELGWEPRHNFINVLDRLKADEKLLSPLAYIVGEKGYHATEFDDGHYPVKSADR